MFNYIKTHVMDLLAGDARLLGGGNAWAAGFAAVKRLKAGDVLTAGCVNLIDHSYAPAGGSSRPAIYCGSQGFGASDKLETPSMASGRNEYRVMTLPLIVVAQQPTLLAAEAQRDQLVHNVRRILFDHIAESGYWYEIEVPGDTGGGAARIIPTSSAHPGIGASGVAEAFCPVPLVIRYTYGPGAPA